METVEWIIENIEPAAITAVISALAGGAVGFRIGINKKQNQSQRAGSNSHQIQIGRDFKMKE